MTENDAIFAATSTSARAIGVADDRGVVEVGKIADFVVLAGNPLDDIGNVWNTQLVMKSGETLSPDSAGTRNAFRNVLHGLDQREEQR